jgi:hypothetical protein
MVIHQEEKITDVINTTLHKIIDSVNVKLGRESKCERTSKC